MRATYLLLAEQSVPNAAGLDLTNAGLNVFWVIGGLPNAIPPFCLIVGIEIGWNDVEIAYIGEVRFIDADGHDLKDPGAPPLTWTRVPHHAEGVPEGEAYIEAMTITLHKFVARRYGTHRIEVWLNGQFAQSVNVFIQPVPATGIPPQLND